MISKQKLCNFLLDIQFVAEKLADSQEIEWGNRAVLDVLDKIFKEIESVRLDA